jgi:oligopeptide transport system ATP-binding protein
VIADRPAAPTNGKDATPPLVSVSGLSKAYALHGASAVGGQRSLWALRSVSFDLARGSTLAVVGESGSGKTTLARIVLGLMSPTAGTVSYEGRDIHKVRAADLRRIRRLVQPVFQNPYLSLNPALTPRQAISEALLFHKVVPRSAVAERLNGLMSRVGLRADALDKRPSRLSGGERQRIAIARALAVEPEFVVADEPVSALDVSVQAQILNLLTRLQRESGLTYLFITHDLAVARHVSQRIAVLYRGEVVETGDTAATYAKPLHPYTQALVGAAPRVGRPIDPPATTKLGPREDPAAGCPFAARCPAVMEMCWTVRPALRTVDRQQVACHLYRDTEA